MQNSSFSNFYQEYLGLADSVICNAVRLCKSKYRDIPINKKYFYKVIATKYNGEKIISYSPDINETELKSLNAKIKFEAMDLGVIQDDLKLPQYELSYMNRMFLDNHASIALATKLGFEVKQRELVVSYTRGIN